MYFGAVPTPTWGGPNTAVEAVDVEGVPGGGVNPCLRGESNPLAAAAGGVLESNRTVGERGEGVGEEVGKVGGAVAVLGGSAVTGLITALVWTSVISSRNCSLALFLCLALLVRNIIDMNMWNLIRP